jgi:hypothetical protein
LTVSWLQIFEDATKLFSTSEVPLIVDAVPILEDIADSLQAVCDDEDDELPNVVQVAAQAALLLTHKYLLLSADCELYQIAIGWLLFHLCLELCLFFVLF